MLEIGPGRGELTRPLASRVETLIVVELDRDLAAGLTADAIPRVRVVQGDFLTTDLRTILANEPMPFRVVGNLPYNVASPILFRLVDLANAGQRFSDATIMLQKEVADRLVSQPGESNYGALPLQIGLDADVIRLLSLPPGAFRPMPRVSSSVVRLRFRAPLVDVGDRAVFKRLVRGLFLQRRKTLLNALKPVAKTMGVEASEVIDSAGLSTERRPQTLSVSDMARLSRAVL
jgi:16S rRNA (adenine1518-N6/adenine1519-N6)-dimethyltransferase